MLDHRIQLVRVVSLSDDLDRRAHIKTHFADIGIDRYRFVEGVQPTDEAVKAMYRARRVAAFPNCFRCNTHPCDCENNVLIPQQVANWLSFLKVWAVAAAVPGLTLICEDDVSFYGNAMACLSSALDKVLEEFGSESEISDYPLLIRLAASGIAPEGSVNPETVVLTDDVVMSNAAYVINQPMARLLLSHFLRIDTTSDVFVHRKAETWDGVRACTVKPLLATELSFNRDFAQFVSRIHPKGISGNDELRKQSHFQRAVNESDYRQQRNGWISRPE